MNEREQARNVFGKNDSNLGGLSNITSDMWAPISGAKPAVPNRQTRTSSAQKTTSASQKRPDTSSKGKSQGTKKQPGEKKSGYVSSKTGKAQPKQQMPKGRISDSRPLQQEKKNDGRLLSGGILGNIMKTSANNKKGGAAKRETASDNTFRTPQSKRTTPVGKMQFAEPQRQAQRNQQRPNQQNRTPSKASQLSKRERDNLRKDKELFEKGRRQGKSKDEIRREVQQKKLKKRKMTMLMTFVAFIAAMVLLLGGYIYYEGAIVDNITVEGKSKYSAKQIIESCGVEVGDNLLGVREKDVKETLTQDLPYIKDVTVKYSLPDTVVITVSSTSDKMLLVNKNKYLRLDMDGKVLATSKTKLKDGIYKIEGLTYKKTEIGAYYEPVEKDSEKYETARQIVSVCEATDGLASGVINVKDLSDITVVYDSRIKIYLGNTDDLESKLSLAMRTIKDAASQNQTGYVDMRFSKMGYFSEGSMDNG